MRGERGRSWLLVLGLLVGFLGQSQSIRVNGGFVEDSLLIGQDVTYWLTACYSEDLEVIFPDSTFKFEPFEYSDKEYYPSKLVNGEVFDSTVYRIQSFEIDPTQYFFAPVYVLAGLDSTIINSPLDSIYFQELAPIVTDTTSLIANSRYELVIKQFNYPLMYYVVGGLIVLALALLAIFGKKIIKFFRLRKLRKEYEKFSMQLSDHIHALKSKPESEVAERALYFWKRYQEKLDKYPFTKSTTKEILAQSFAKELEKPLSSIDRLIYGKRPTETVFQDFQQIEDYTQYRYNKKVEEIRNGK